MNRFKEKYFFELSKLLIALGREAAKVQKVAELNICLQAMQAHWEFYRPRLRMNQEEWEFIKATQAQIDYYLSESERPEGEPPKLLSMLILEVVCRTFITLQMGHRCAANNRARMIAATPVVEENGFDGWFWGAVGAEIVTLGTLLAFA